MVERKYFRVIIGELEALIVVGSCVNDAVIGVVFVLFCLYLKLGFVLFVKDEGEYGVGIFVCEAEFI